VPNLVWAVGRAEDLGGLSINDIWKKFGLRMVVADLYDMRLQDTDFSGKSPFDV
jgi:hypothetical protein